MSPHLLVNIFYYTLLSVLWHTGSLSEGYDHLAVCLTVVNCSLQLQPHAKVGLLDLVKIVQITTTSDRNMTPTQVMVK